MTIDDQSGEEVVGRCPYIYFKFDDPNITSVGLYYKVPGNIHVLENALCGRLNRRGLLCGKCKAGYGYPNFLECVECTPNLYAQNWVQYIFISFGPLTLFLIVVVCLRINATSAPSNTFVFISQVIMITQPPFARGFITTINASFLSEGGKIFVKLLYGV